MKKLNVLAISAVVAAGSLVSGAATAGVTANVGAASNYVWRGVTLSGEGPQVFGGVDYSHDSGLYAGVWQSSEGDNGNSSETDLYVGFSRESGKISYDIGFVSYMYPQDATVPDADYDEIYFSVGYDFAELFYATSSDIDADYMSLTLSYDKYSFVYGDYSFDAPNSDYSHFDLGVAFNR